MNLRNYRSPQDEPKIKQEKKSNHILDHLPAGVTYISEQRINSLYISRCITGAIYGIGKYGVLYKLIVKQTTVDEDHRQLFKYKWVNVFDPNTNELTVNSARNQHHTMRDFFNSNTSKNTVYHIFRIHNIPSVIRLLKLVKLDKYKYGAKDN